MDQIFNELSVSASCSDKFQANAAMELMLGVSRSLVRCGFNSTLRVIQDFSQLSLAPNYTIHQWAIDNTCNANRDFQRLLLVIASNAPYIEEFISELENDCVIEFKHNGQNATGLGLAHLWNGVAISLSCDDSFTDPNIEINFKKYCEDNEDDNLVSVFSASNTNHIPLACQKLNKLNLSGINNGAELFRQFSKTFPKLICCDSAAKQLSALNGREQFFHEILRHLQILNSTIAAWVSGPFSPQGISWSSESNPTMEKYGKQREFSCPDGLTRIFPLHTKLYSSNQRIHFLPALDEGIVYIGYVGNHLSTVNHPT